MQFCDGLMLETESNNLTLYPDELDTIFNTEGGVLLRIGDMVLQCIIEATEYWRKRQLILRSAGSAAILSMLYIFQGESYTIRTHAVGEHVLVSKNTLPNDLPTKVGWAFGFTSRNKMSMPRLQNVYQEFREKYASSKSLLADNSAMTSPPVYKVFSSWLHATYRADENGGYQDVPVYWATNGAPTYEEALGLMGEMSTKCASAHNKSRIDYVMNQVRSAA